MFGVDFLFILRKNLITILELLYDDSLDGRTDTLDECLETDKTIQKYVMLLLRCFEICLYVRYRYLYFTLICLK